MATRIRTAFSEACRSSRTKARRLTSSAIVLTAPADTVPPAPAQLEEGTGDLAALLAAGRDELLFGARMVVDFAPDAAPGEGGRRPHGP
ncbi:hypothetical protein [Streptomyces coeruleorubidus]|uniref:Uncharacterized protein n=1 Tax=Streptomyces coeruleorubidus TaxID=116188 RepID=A0A5J6IEL0_STRC4|nr:hypothetical protein [Streptomyces coeruleorubidus]QEV30022.1 hypothetical protein CP976_42080 [Streptomyces coeruleorubidus]GGT84655.1 hypothetical protein GCM10010256_51040 [Streptomyces coeruleorubidus]